MSGMKSSSKEINIINMSLLDILCGAMGAFCFMMLALFPYWSPSGVSGKDAVKQAQEMQKELEKLRQALRNSAGPEAADALARLEKLQREMQRLEGERNRLQQELEESKKTARRMEMRNPTMALVSWGAPNVDIDIFIHLPNIKTNGGQSQPPVDPFKKQGHYFGGDFVYGTFRGPGYDFWLMRDTVANSRCDVYYKFIASNGNTAPVQVSGIYINDSKSYPMPTITMTQEKTARKVGTIVVNTDYSLRFEPVPELAASYRQQLAAAQQPQQSGK